MKTKIACPKCDWEPDDGAYWQCSCGHAWNTFETYGKCPACGKVWVDTQCPDLFFLVGGCGKWSKHHEWYRGWEDEVKLEIEKFIQKEPAEV